MADTMPSAPITTSGSRGALDRVNAFLDRFVLPYPVHYLTNRVVILATLCLLVPLIVFANVTVFVLAANSYLNVMSVVVSSTVLLYSALSEARERAAAQRREEIAAEHQKMLDARSEEDHRRIVAIHDHLDELRKEVMEHVNASLDGIQKTLVERLEKIQDEDHVHIQDLNQEVMESLAAHREELTDLNAMIQALRADAARKEK